MEDVGGTNPQNLKDVNVIGIMNVKDQLVKWKDYISELFYDQRSVFHLQDCTTGPTITIEEFSQAVQTDEVANEIMKLLGKGGDGTWTKLFYSIHTLN